MKVCIAPSTSWAKKSRLGFDLWKLRAFTTKTACQSEGQWLERISAGICWSVRVGPYRCHISLLLVQASARKEKKAALRMDIRAKTLFAPFRSYRIWLSSPILTRIPTSKVSCGRGVLVLFASFGCCLDLCWREARTCAKLTCRTAVNSGSQGSRAILKHRHKLVGEDVIEDRSSKVTNMLTLMYLGHR